MDETLDVTQQFQDDADDWDIDLSDIPELNTEEDLPQDEQQTQEKEEQPQEEQEADKATEAQEDGFIIRVNHQDEKISREEGYALMQKGRDYDRVRALLDKKESENAQAAEALDFLKNMATQSNMSVEEFMDSAVAVQRAKADKSDYDAVLAQVKMERREKALNAREEKLNQEKQQEDAKAQAAQKRQADVQNFLQRFPGVRADTIPKEVWAEVAKGLTLTEAYAIHENTRLQNELEAERQNNKNAARSAGSRATAGKQERDAFDALWYDDD